MNNEELLQAIKIMIQDELKPIKIEVTNIKNEITDMKGEITSVKSEITDMKGEIYSVKSEITDMKVEITSVKTEITDMKGEIASVKADMATATQQNENTQLIKAILHNIETINAEINALKLTTLSTESLSHLATKEDINDLDAKFEVLNARLFHQETELYKLKVVK